MKLDNTSLNIIAGWMHNGNVIMVEQMPLLGSYTGGVEETAICDVATTLASFTMMNASYHLDGPIHIRWGTTTTRETMQIAGHVAAAIDAHTDLLIANQYYSLAGPCTDMCLKEIAAQSMLDTASGRELVSGVATAKGVTEDFATGMEARVLGEVAMATAGMKVEKVNEIIEQLVGDYERKFTHAPKGKRFQECYDVDTVRPSREYVDVYRKFREDLTNLGLDFK
ncbi:Monomethylamine methyltransferase MtmB [anaerobic digester metagenome]|jgi:methylamine--corrinoid protein Co-methyltransferase